MITEDIPIPSLARKFNNDELKEPKHFNRRISDRTNKAILEGMEIEPSDQPQSVEKWLDILKTPKNIIFLEYPSLSFKLFQFDTVRVAI